MKFLIKNPIILLAGVVVVFSSCVAPSKIRSNHGFRIQRETQQDTAPGTVASFSWSFPTGYTNRLSNTLPSNSGGLAPFGSITIKAPTNGYVLVHASADAYTYPDGSSYWALMGSISTRPDTAGPLTFDIHWNTNNASLPEIWSQSYLFPVSAGVHTFYLNFWKAPYGDPAIRAVSITGMFVKNQK
jgi:hypothetical protein